MALHLILTQGHVSRDFGRSLTERNGDRAVAPLRSSRAGSTRYLYLTPWPQESYCIWLQPALVPWLLTSSEVQDETVCDTEEGPSHKRSE